MMYMYEEIGWWASPPWKKIRICNGLGEGCMLQECMKGLLSQIVDNLR